MSRARVTGRLVLVLLLAAGTAAASAQGRAGRGGRGRGEKPPTPEERARQAAMRTVDTMSNSTQLVRETFAYRSSGRDPFLSLLKSGGVRPLIGDLRVVGINYDPRYPAQSVVTLQDTTVHKRYTLKVNDEVGRIRVTEIRPQEVVLTLDEFGTERQVVLSLRRRQEETR